MIKIDIIYLFITLSWGVSSRQYCLVTPTFVTYKLPVTVQWARELCNGVLRRIFFLKTKIEFVRDYIITHTVIIIIIIVVV